MPLGLDQFRGWLHAALRHNLLDGGDVGAQVTLNVLKAGKVGTLHLAHGRGAWVRVFFVRVRSVLILKVRSQLKLPLVAGGHHVLLMILGLTHATQGARVMLDRGLVEEVRQISILQRSGRT